MNSVATEKTTTKTVIDNRQWHASLALEFYHSSYGTQLVKTTRKGPLSVQKAFYPEGQECAHIYLLHPPAGIVSGDTLTINVHVNPSAHVLVTTPGANRFYRARDNQLIGCPEQKQSTVFQVNSKAICENFPQETIVYEGACGFNTVDVSLEASSIYLGWDITCLGLPSSNQPFAEGEYTQLNRMYCDDKLIYHDRIAIKPNNQLLHHSAGLASFSVFGTFLIFAEQLRDHHQAKAIALVNELREIIETQKAEKFISVTQMKGLIVIRYLGEQATQCKRLFILLWQCIRPQLIDCLGIEPRVWHT